MRTYSFEKLEVWQLSRSLVNKIYIITRSFPDEEKFGLTNQIRRASVSVSSNIAEGNSRLSSKDKAHFFQISYSSLMEVLNQLIIAYDLQFIDDLYLGDIRLLIDEIANKLNSLHKSLNLTTNQLLNPSANQLINSSTNQFLNSSTNQLPMPRLAIILTHPIQYYSPLFKLMTERNKISIKVFYTWEQSKEKVFDSKFGKEIKWDIPLLDGYEYTFVKNTSLNPGSGNFKGVINPTLISEIEEWRASALLVFGWNHHSHLFAMKYFKGKIPVYFRGDSTLLDEQKSVKTIIRRLWLKYVYSFVDRAFYVGKNNKDYFLKHGLTECQLIFAPHAIDNNRFEDKNGEYREKTNKWRKELGYKEDDFVFLFVGKFEPKKNPLLLLDAAKKFPKQQFLFVGNGELENRMKEMSSGMNNVKFLPFQNQSLMPVVYRLGDVYVLPSQGPGETWGLAVNEAMASGRPVLVSDKVGCAVDLANRSPHQIFCSGNEKELGRHIELAYHNRNHVVSQSIVEQIKPWSFEKIAEAMHNELLKV